MLAFFYRTVDPAFRGRLRFGFQNQIFNSPVIGIFKQKNQGNALLLIIYGLVLKFPSFLHPQGPLRQPGNDHYLYNWLLNFLDPLKLPDGFYAFISFVLIFLQATLFNRICSELKMYHKPNYLAGMSYMLISSLFPVWNVFSAPLLVNFFLIWIFYRMTNLYNTNKPGNAIFNIGVIMGLVTLTYQPAIVFILLILFSLFIMRPFRIREWFIGLLGVTAPYYFLALVLFLTNNWNWKLLLPGIDFTLPMMPSSLIVTFSIVLLVVPFIIGGFFIQNNLSKMLIQVRKNWSLLLLFLIMAMLIIVINGNGSYVNWVLCIVPLAGFHGAVYFYANSRWVAGIVHWIIFAWVIYTGYFFPESIAG